MFEKFLSGNTADFRQRYQGTFGFFMNEKKPPILCKLAEVEHNVRFVDRRGIEYTLDPDTEKEIGFKFLPPKSGYFNTDEGAIYVQRAASRQFQRGISDRNTQMYLLAEDRFRPVSVGFKYLEKVFEPSLTAKEAYERLVTATAPSVALSTQFGMDKTTLFVFATAVGKVRGFNKEKLTLKLDDQSLFRTEIMDAMKGIVNVEFA